MQPPLAGLAVLACPLGMGALLWFMLRGMSAPEQGSEADMLAELQAERRRIDAEVRRRHAAGREPRAAEAVTEAVASSAREVRRCGVGA